MDNEKDGFIRLDEPSVEGVGKSSSKGKPASRTSGGLIGTVRGKRRPPDWNAEYDQIEAQSDRNNGIIRVDPLPPLVAAAMEGLTGESPDDENEGWVSIGGARFNGSPVVVKDLSGMPMVAFVPVALQPLGEPNAVYHVIGLRNAEGGWAKITFDFTREQQYSNTNLNNYPFTKEQTAQIMEGLKALGVPIKTRPDGEPEKR